ncbi:hypothetical protein K402DRAFT_297052, partial [Aulographum hederae CBS 113979]
DNDDAWDDFEVQPSSHAPPEATQKKSQSAPVEPSQPLPFSITLSPSIPDISPSDIPPTTIPPPALLLSLFPSIIANAQSSFFNPLAAQPVSVRSNILASPSAQRFLNAYLLIGVVAARLIAGRKARWKRDQILAQSMRIGTAGGKGMKLAGVDKGEVRKEEREVTEVVRVWRQHLGRLRSVVTAANAAVSSSGGGKERIGPVPELQEMIPLKTATQLDGGVPAPRPCALCGMKRDERVGEKLEAPVQDWLGEWWLDSLSMHRSCRNFWHEHKDALQTK